MKLPGIYYFFFFNFIVEKIFQSNCRIVMYDLMCSIFLTILEKKNSYIFINKNS